MMNMRTEKNKTELSDKILYRWKKEWVRPYESIYSIFRNFCRVNVMQNSYVLKMFHFINSQAESANPKLLMYSKTAKKSVTNDELYEKLLPDWYQKQTKLLSELNTKTFQQLIDRHIRYCPECMKENYHSFLFQFYGAEDCIFHKCKLIKTPFPYAIEGSINYGKTQDIRNVQDMQLPFERTINNEFYEKNCNISLECYIPIRSIRKDCAYKYIHALEPFRKNPFQRKNDGVSFNVPKTSCTEKELFDSFTLWFNQQKIPTDLLNPERDYILEEEWNNSYNTNSYGYTSHFLYYLVYEFMKPYDLQNEEKRKSILEISNMRKILIRSDEEFELKLCFLWAIYSYDTLYYCLNNIALIKSCTDENNREIYNGVHLLYLEDGYSASPSVLTQTDKTIILLYILKDLFFCVWNEFRAMAVQDGYIRVSDGWKLISVPEYYICKNKNDDFYTVLRYNNGIHKGK